MAKIIPFPRLINRIYPYGVIKTEPVGLSQLTLVVPADD